METVIIEAEVSESVATVLTRLPAVERAHLRRVVSAAAVEFANATVSDASANDPDAWDNFLQQNSTLAVSGLPTDLSVNHDHYLHGAPKRIPAP